MKVSIWFVRMVFVVLAVIVAIYMARQIFPAPELQEYRPIYDLWAALAGLVKLQAGPGRLEPGAGVVILATGHGLKDVEAPLARISIPPAIEPTLEALPA